MLRTVRTSLDDQQLFVPQISVTVAYVLTVASVLGLVLFLAHLAKEIRAETMLANVHQDANDTLNRFLPGPNNAEATVDPPPVPPHDARGLTAGSSGFLVRIDERAILAAATRADAILMIDRTPGSSLVANTPIGVCWPLPDRSLHDNALETLRTDVERAVHTGNERTAAGDVGFGLRQLTDVAIKALSPGINDPTTAVHALGHSSSLLCELAQRDLEPRLLRDQAGRVRVILQRASFGDLLELAVGQPRRYGATDPDVLGRLFLLLHEIAWTAPRAGQRHLVADQLDRLRATTAAQDYDAAERAHLAALGLRVEKALTRRMETAIPETAAGNGGDQP